MIGLFVNWDVNPLIFKIGGLSLRWYGLLFVSGFVFGYWLFTRFFRKEGLPTKPLLDPMLYMLLLCALIGARLGHIIFYEPDYYLSNPAEILKVWKGGLASHGGAIAVVFGVIWYAKKYGGKYHFDFMWIVDRLAVAIPFAGMAIRLGNLMNSEIYGVQTSLPWGFVFVRDGMTEPHHPTQIYEALSYLVIGIVLLVLYNAITRKGLEIRDRRAKEAAGTRDPKAKAEIRSAEAAELGAIGIYRGFIFGLFLILLFTARFLIEYVKENQVAAEAGRILNNGQLLSIPFIVTGIAVIIWSFRTKKPVVREI